MEKTLVMNAIVLFLSIGLTVIVNIFNPVLKANSPVSPLVNTEIKFIDTTPLVKDGNKLTFSMIRYETAEDALENFANQFHGSNIASLSSESKQILANENCHAYIAWYNGSLITHIVLIYQDSPWVVKAQLIHQSPLTLTQRKEVIDSMIVKLIERGHQIESSR